MNGPDLELRMAPPMVLALQASFGSVDRWHDEWTAFHYVAGGGTGRCVLALRQDAGRLVNLRLAIGAALPAGLVALLEVDASRAGVIDWDAAYQRYQQAVHEASEPFGATQEEAVAGALLLDVRRAAVFQQAPTLIPGARWFDPARVESWAGSLPADRELIIYCVYGHEVGRATALRLRSAGRRARFLRGGIDGWQAAARPLQAKGTAP